MKPITITQSEQQAKLAFAVHRNATLESIRLRSARLESVHPSEIKDEPVELDFRFIAKNSSAPEGTLRIEVSFLVRVLPKLTKPKKGEPSVEGKTSRKANLETEMTFEADYKLEPNYLPDEATVEAFQNGNAVFNVWPYFREALQNATVRMGHGPVTAPFLKLCSKPVDGSESGDTDHVTPRSPKKRKIGRQD